MNAPRHWRTLTLRGNYCSTLCHHSSLRCNCQSKPQWIKELRVLIDIFCVCTRPKATLAELLYLMLSPTFCFSFSTPCKHWCNNAFHYTEERRWVSLVAPLHLNNRSTAVFKKLITFLAVAKVSRDAPRCNIGSSDQRQISAEMRKSCLWWVQHVNDLCVFIGHGAGPASLQDSGVGTAPWQRLATADGKKQARGGLTWSSTSQFVLSLYSASSHRLYLPCVSLFLSGLLILGAVFLSLASWMSMSPVVLKYLREFDAKEGRELTEEAKKYLLNIQFILKHTGHRSLGPLLGEYSLRLQKSTFTKWGLLYPMMFCPPA